MLTSRCSPRHSADYDELLFERNQSVRRDLERREATNVSTVLFFLAGAGRAGVAARCCAASNAQLRSTSLVLAMVRVLFAKLPPCALLVPIPAACACNPCLQVCVAAWRVVTRAYYENVL